MAVSVCIPAWAGVIWHVALPFAFVDAEHVLLPNVKLTVWFARAAGGSADTSESEATTDAPWPGIPLFGLALRLRNVACVPTAQVTTEVLDLRGVLLAWAVAMIWSLPAK